MTVSRIAVYPGTFDPITYGHIDIIERGVQLFNKVVVAVTAGTGKSPLVSPEQRIALAQQVFAANLRVEVVPFTGLLVDFMQNRGIQYVLRGIRNVADMQHEFQLATMNKIMKPEMETVFLQANERFAHVSSTIVREIAAKAQPGSLGNLSLFVPPLVATALQNLR
jgi:pantetheine-phosphate adenylyltransferase